MIRFRSAVSIRLGCLPLALGLSVSAFAAETPAIDTIVVTASRVREDGFTLPVSISTVDGANIQSQQLQVNLSESLAAVPGLLVQSRENYAQDLQISSRGFGARATFGVRGLRVYVDGIPATMPDGQSQTSHIDLASAGRIEVLRGPFSALYGNSAGGVIAVFTEDAKPGATLEGGVQAGSNGFVRYSAKASGISGNLSYVVGAARFRTDGGRDHSAASRSDVNAKLGYASGDHEIGLVVNGVDLPDAQDALGLTRAQLQSDPSQAGTSAVTFNTRKSVRQGQVGMTYTGQFGPQDTVKALIYAGHRTTVQYQAIPVASQTPATSPGGVIDLANDYRGADISWTHHTEIGGMRLRFTGGLNTDRLDSKRRGYSNFVGTVVGVKGALRRDENNLVSNFDQYFQAEVEPNAHWLILAGLRHTRLALTSRDHYIVPGNGDDSGNQSYGGTNPVAGVTYRLTPSVSVYASYGKGLQTPTTDELSYRSLTGTQTGLNLGLRASRSDNFEVGVKARAENVLLTAAAFRIDTTDEIVVQGNSGGRSIFQNVAATTRKGLELSAEANWPGGFGARLAYTLLDASADQGFPSCSGTPCVVKTVPAGSALAGIPRHVAFGELSWRHVPSGFEAAAEARAVSKIYVDDFASDGAPGYVRANLRAGFAQSGASWKISEFVRVDNATDRRYVGSVIVNESNGRYFEPALGRAVYGGISGRVTW